MRGTKKQMKNKPIITCIGEIPILWDIENKLIRERVIKHYQNYFVNKKPQITIKVKKEKFNIPKVKKPIFQTRSWILSKNGDYLNLYFPGRNNASLASIHSSFKKVDFFTQDSNGQLLLYLFPEILYSLILPKFNNLLLHSCGILDNKRAYLFVAKAEGGKSTIAKLSGKRTILNDDRIIIRKEEKGYKIYGNPWHGEVEETSNKSFYIKDIFFLKKSNLNYIKPIRKSEAMVEFFKNSFYLPIDNDIIKQVFGICSGIVKGLNCYQFGFVPDKSIWRFLNGAVK